MLSRMTLNHLLCSLMVFLIGSTLAWAEDESGLSYTTHQGQTFPPVFLVTNVKSTDIAEQLESFGAFEKIDKKAVGLPIGLRVLNGRRTKQDGKGISSALFSAGTLGLVPIFSNTEFKVRYELFVQGKLLKAYDFVFDSKDIDNPWAASYKDRAMKPSESQFLNDSLSMFLSELSKDEVALELFKEYDYYFR